VHEIMQSERAFGERIIVQIMMYAQMSGSRYIPGDILMRRHQTLKLRILKCEKKTLILDVSKSRQSVRHQNNPKSCAIIPERRRTCTATWLHHRCLRRSASQGSSASSPFLHRKYSSGTMTCHFGGSGRALILEWRRKTEIEHFN
jgi:hypothetical protein